MIIAVTGEVAIGIAEPGDLGWVFGASRIIHGVGYAKAEQIDVETDPVFHIGKIETEMA